MNLHKYVHPELYTRQIAKPSFQCVNMGIADNHEGKIQCITGDVCSLAKSVRSILLLTFPDFRAPGTNEYTISCLIVPKTTICPVWLTELFVVLTTLKIACECRLTRRQRGCRWYVRICVHLAHTWQPSICRMPVTKIHSYSKTFTSQFYHFHFHFLHMLCWFAKNVREFQFK